MSNLYLTRETAEALWRDCVEPAQDGKLTLHDVRHAIDSLPVVDEVPAEEALDAIEHDMGAPNLLAHHFAAVRHALRAARVIEDLAVSVPLWNAINEYAAACGGNVAAAGGSDRRMDAVAAIGGILRAAQAQADAPPPPDVIRRGHRAMDRIVCAGEDGPDAPEWGDQEVADVRAAMYPLPKEE